MTIRDIENFAVDRYWAEDAGYDVHHDWMGWYVVGPHEEEPESGYSLGFDGRRHFKLAVDAWTEAAREAASHI